MKGYVGILLVSFFKLNISFATNAKHNKCSYDYSLPSDYNKLEAPFKGLEPLETEVTLEVLQILEIDGIKFNVSLLMDFYVDLEDYRITGPIPDDPEELVLIDIRFVQV